LEESGSGYLDATGNNNDSDAQTAPTRVTGRTGYGQDFTMTNSEYIRVASSASLSVGTADLSFSMWIKPETSATTMFPFSYRDGTTYDGYWIYSGTSTQYDPKFYMEGQGSPTQNALVPNIPNGSWTHIAYTCDRDNDVGFIPYMNGAAITPVDPTACQGALVCDGPLYLGTNAGLVDYFDGMLDEIRISNIVRPAAWVKFECLNMDDGHAAGNELTWGDEEDDPAEIEIQYGVIIIEDGGTHDYGNVIVNSTLDHQFSIWNLGEANLTLSGTPIITITGANADQFSVVQQPTSPVTGSSYTTFIIRFAPTSLGAKTAAISIVNDDADENPYDIALNGAGSEGGTIKLNAVRSIIKEILRAVVLR